jgi:D-amino-acid oxidase
MGRGVIGLSCAIRLKQLFGKRVRVTVGGAAGRESTQSWKAAAFWYPFKAVGYRPEWATMSYFAFSQLDSEREPRFRASGVFRRNLIEYFEYGHAHLLNTLWWLESRGNFSEFIERRDSTVFCRGAEIPIEAKVNFETFVADMPTYLVWLEDVCRRLKVDFTDKLAHTCNTSGQLREFIQNAANPQASDRIDAFVLAAGIFSHKLTHDATEESAISPCGRPENSPVRGNLVFVKPKQDIREVHLFQHGLAWHDQEPRYVVPREDYVVLGGTYETRSPRVKITSNKVAEPDPIACNKILEDCKELVPQLRECEVIRYGYSAGFRPNRLRGPRVEVLPADVDFFGKGVTIAYCYGHGGSGVTFSWGCANEVALSLGERLHKSRPMFEATRDFKFGLFE